MDQLTPSLPAPKTRRKHSAEFKARVLKACQEPGSSTASVAQQYQINANLIHKWRRQFAKQGAGPFISLPSLSTAPTASGRCDDVIRIELPNGIVAQWPLDRIMDSVPWLKALQS